MMIQDVDGDACVIRNGHVAEWNPQTGITGIPAKSHRPWPRTRIRYSHVTFAGPSKVVCALTWMLTVCRACRFVGSLLGLPIACTFLWWYWPEANGFVTDPFAIMMMIWTVLCDLLYPFCIATVRRTEVVLDDGTVVAGWSPEAQAKKRV